MENPKVIRVVGGCASELKKVKPGRLPCFQPKNGKKWFLKKVYSSLQGGAPEEGKSELGKTTILSVLELGKTCLKSNSAMPEEGQTELGQILQTRFR